MDKSSNVKKFLLEKKWFKNIEGVSFLAAGEYNDSYKVDTNKESYVFRINHGSQLNIENQIEYEFNVLSALKNSTVTPKPVFYDKNPSAYFDGGVLLMEYIKGEPLDYKNDIDKAAYVFSKTHVLPINENFIVQKNPVRDIADESYIMINRYNYDEMDNVKTLLLKYYEKMMKLSMESAGLFENEKMCIVNTKVNSKNFIIDGGIPYLVDWGKAVVSYRYQDLGYFLTPTTTLWKTGYKYIEDEKKRFLNLYQDFLKVDISLDELYEKTKLLEKIILLRALSWCYMAYYEYTHQDRNLKNIDTFSKIKRYLDEAECFLV